MFIDERTLRGDVILGSDVVWLSHSYHSLGLVNRLPLVGDTFSIGEICSFLPFTLAIFNIYIIFVNM
jgi:hypothetical protein